MARSSVSSVHAAPVLALLLAAGPLLGQGPEWASNQAHPPASPSLRRVAADPVRGRLVTFDTGSQRTWEFDGVAWSERAIGQTGLSSIAGGNCLTFDAGRGRVVYLRWPSVGSLGSMWDWDGTTWNYVTSAPAIVNAASGWQADMVHHGGSNPGLLCVHSGMTWRFANGQWSMASSWSPGGNLLYVPQTGLTYSANGYVWNGSSWSQVTSNWTGFNFLDWCWDPSRNQVVAHASSPSTGFTAIGTLTTPSHFSWTFSSNQTPQSSVEGTPPGQPAELAFDPVQGRTTLLLSLSSTSNARYVLGSSGTTWQTFQASTARPSDRLHADLSYDPALNRSVLFGGLGSGASGTLGDTWSFDGSYWTNHGTNLGAGPRVLARQAYLANQGTVMFGGATAIGGTFLNDTLVWNGTSWIPLFSLQYPAPRYAHDMVSVGNTSIWMFGGYGGTYRNDTWRLGSSGWQAISTAGPTPPPRSSHRLAYDARRGRIVLFGGQGVGATRLGDTWELVPFGTPTWIQMAPQQSPPGRWNHAMDYDPMRGVVVMTGGYDSLTQTFLGDVWEYDGVTWRQRTPTGNVPSGREAAAFAWHPPAQRFVLQGGYTQGAPNYPSETSLYRATIDSQGPGMFANGFPLRTTYPVAGRDITLSFDSPLGFGWVLVSAVPDPVGLPLLPDPLFCGGGRIHGAGGAIGDATGSPGRITFSLPASIAGFGFTAQGIRLEAPLCVSFSDPLALTPASW